MSLGDFPQIPAKHKPRIQKVFNKIKSDELTLEEVLTNILTTFGKVSLDGDGIKVSGSYGCFEVGERFLDDMEQAAMPIVDALPQMLKKKQLLLKIGEKLKLVTMGYMGFWITKGTGQDLKNKKLPVIEIISNPVDSIKLWFINFFNFYLHAPLEEWVEVPAFMKVHRIEEFGAWAGNDWKFISHLLRAVVPVCDLSTKEVMDKLGGPVDAYTDEVCKRCGE